jgi:hypothetical protein
MNRRRDALFAMGCLTDAAAGWAGRGTLFDQDRK